MRNHPTAFFLMFFCACFFMLASPSLLFATRHETGFLNRTITVNGVLYRYQVFVPENWDQRKPWPVILFLHGAGERGDDGFAQTAFGLPQAIRLHAADFPFVVVMPQCRKDKRWPDPDMEAQVFAALDRTMKEFHGDPDRVYLTGLSMGGFGALAFGAFHPGKFAAVVPVCGGIKPIEQWPPLWRQAALDANATDPYAETARRLGKTPIWLFHGDADPRVPVEQSRKMHAALQDAGGNVKYTEYPGVDHNSWDKAYAEPGLVPWLLAHHLKP
jgi:predicted peptidase